MSVFQHEWTEESEVFSLDLSGGTYVLRAKPGQEAAFSAFTRDIINRSGDFVALPRLGDDGQYDSVQIIAPDSLRLAID